MVATHASYSSITSWMRCGEQYRLTKVKRAKEHPSWWLAGGSAVHEATEVYDLAEPADQATFDEVAVFDEVFAPRVESIEASMTGRWEGMEPKAAGRANNKQDAAWWAEHGPPMVRAWIDWQQETGWRPALVTWEHWGAPTPAVEMDVSVDSFAGYQMRAYLDRVMQHPDGTLAIVDIKTGSRKPDSPMQLGFYRVLLRMKYGLDVPLGGYFMNRKGEIELQRLDKYDDEFVGRFVKGFMKAREMGLYLPNVGMACGTCGVAYACWAVGGADADAYAPEGEEEPPPPVTTTGSAWWDELLFSKPKLFN